MNAELLMKIAMSDTIEGKRFEKLLHHYCRIKLWRHSMKQKFSKSMT